jgi:hypothetical protein
MSIFSLYSSTPLPGKAQLMETRLRTVLGIIAQKGALGTRLHQDRIGANAGNMAMVAEFESFHHATSVFDQLWKDPLFLDINQQRQKDPAGIPYGPVFMRDVCGQPDISAGCHVYRNYKLERKNLDKAIKLMNSVSKLSNEFTVCGVIPVLSPEMDTMTAVYQFDSVVDAGKFMDQVGLSPEFQKIVSQASEIGTLVQAGMNVHI